MSPKARKIVGYTTLAFIIGVGIAIAVRRKKNAKLIDEINGILDGTKEDPSKPKGSGQVDLNKTDLDKLPAGNFPLKVGDKNKKVYDLQRTMNQVYGTNLDMDGKFGQGLYSALCDKFWTFCGSNVGYYGRTISQKDFDEIKNTSRR